MPTPPDLERHREIITAALTSASYAEAARRLGISRERVRQVMKLHKLHRRPEETTLADTMIRAALPGARNLSSLARAVGLRAERVALALDRMGLPIPRTPPPAHGTTNRYTHYCCRCAPCRRAHANATLWRRRRRQGIPLDAPILRGRPRLDATPAETGKKENR
jgi:hypothetical protein